MWVIGQRVIAEFEPELGLGLVIEVIGVRQIEVLFAGAELTRRYSQQAAPLRRVVLPSGQKAKTKQGQTFTIEKSKEVEGLLLYLGDGLEVWEYELDHLLQDSASVPQILAGRWSHPRAFHLRETGWQLRGRSLSPDTRGLVGPRVSLLPHQLYIASEISKREFPRVLLADEVGLGKTIEAGLIFSALRALGRANRVCLLVPDPLKHQWLAEMYRRFNEMFSLIDEERNEQEELSQGRSAFHVNQRVICPIELLVENIDILDQAMEEPWDLIIVDEAHHLKWSEKSVSPKWDIVQNLASRSRGLLLLTATPEHRGLDTEFGLLNLVDPKRFTSFEQFRTDAEHMHGVAKLANRLMEGDRTKKFKDELTKTFKQDGELVKASADYFDGGAPDDLLHRLIDRHGTGRVLIRNRRDRLKGFPERSFKFAPLKPNHGWADHLAGLDAKKLEGEDILKLASGRIKAPATRKNWFEPRAAWLKKLMAGLGGEKVLLICSSYVVAGQVQNWLKAETSYRTGVFHEGLEMVERDRQAAWFAQPDGAQILLCSEIGGEGRNFQFAHHLVLFDIPLHPDLLEQRIGRLDRIGQVGPIQIHVPFYENTPEEVLARWYAEGLESFVRPWNGGNVMDALREPLTEVCRKYLPKAVGYAKRETALNALIKETHQVVADVHKRQRDSIDCLIDLNSFDETKGNALGKKIREIDSHPMLRDFMEETFNFFGVEVEDLDGPNTFKVTAHSLTFVENFPGLTAHGEQMVTYDRNHALTREEISFMSWDHPIVQGALTLVLEGDAGRLSGGFWNFDQLPAGSIVCEILFVIQVTAAEALEVERDLPLRAMRLFIGPNGDIISPAPVPDLSDINPFSQKEVELVLPKLRELLPDRIERATEVLSRKLKTMIAEATEHRTRRFGAEIARLEQLSRVNQLVSAKEIRLQREKLEEGLAAIQTSVPRVEGIRILVVRPL